MRRLKTRDIPQREIRELLADGYQPSVYQARNGAVVEVSFVKRIGPEPWRVFGCSYMSDHWTPSALARISAMSSARAREGLAQSPTRKKEG